MTYGSFLALFLGVPLLLLVALTGQHAREPWPDPGFAGRRPYAVLLILILVALAYTTPWDNYLVAERVWWYDPQRVLGLRLGQVPLEEYAFFALQTALAGLWLLRLARSDRIGAGPPGRPALRKGAVLAVGIVWLAAAIAIAAHWLPGTYLALELVWALPPIALQLAFGADILWRWRRLVVPAILAPALYLAAADSLAIAQGIWTINPLLSTRCYLGGMLPLEELVFFFLTNTLIAFGMTLGLAAEGQARFRSALLALSATGR